MRAFLVFVLALGVGLCLLDVGPSPAHAQPIFPYPGACPSSGSELSADFDEDGWPDLVNAVGGNVYLCFNNGDGTFTRSVAFPATPSLRGVGDFNGDGHQDVLLGSGVTSLQVMFGHGDGTLDPPGSATIAGNTALNEVVADFNGDGRSDVASINATTHVGVQIMISQGDGTFQVNQVGTESFPQEPTLGDFDGDGNVDLAVRVSVSATGGRLAKIYYGVGDGTFDTLLPLVPVADGPVTIEAGDFNNDNIDDLAASVQYTQAVVVILG